MTLKNFYSTEIKFVKSINTRSTCNKIRRYSAFELFPFLIIVKQKQNVILFYILMTLMKMN